MTANDTLTSTGNEVCPRSSLVATELKLSARLERVRDSLLC